jgi:fermentation-respiration switch protein FrsA (DUF1100 family)
MLYEHPIVFFSAGVRLTGRILRNTPDVTTRQPGVVVTGSWLTVKEQMPERYARRLAELGYTAFIFDFAGFGGSEGTPRQAEIPTRKLEDIAAAARFLSTFSFVNPGGTAHLAICASAQYTVAALAAGAPIRSFVSVAGWYHDATSVAPFYGGEEGVATRLEAAGRAMDRFVRTGELEIVPAYRPNDATAGMFFEMDYYGNADRGAVPAWKNEMAVISWLYWLTFDGLKAAPLVSTPTLIVHGDGCVLTDNVKRVYESLTGEKDLLWIDGYQTDFYDQNGPVEQSIAAAHAHFQKTMG